MTKEIFKFNSEARIKEIKHKFDCVVVKVDKGNFTLYNDVFTSFKMKEGEVYDSNFLNEAIEKNNQTKIIRYVENLQAKSLTNEFFIRKKIESKFKALPYKTKHLAISILKEKRIIDDLKYVKAVNDYFNEKGYGKLRIEKYLYDKHINKDIISKLKFKEEDEIKKAKNYLKEIQKKINNLPPEERFYKTKNLLLRQGFDLITIFEVIDIDF